MFFLRIIMFSLLVIGMSFFFLRGPNYYAPRSLCEFWNLGHVFFFGLFTFVLSTSPICKSYLGCRKYFYSIGLAGIFGLLVEVIQLFIEGRFFSFFDVARDLAGAVVVICWLVARQSRFWVKIGCYGVFFFLLFAILSPFIIALTDEYQARQDFPMLANFNHPFELSRWKHNDKMVLVSEVGGEPLKGARVIFGIAKYSNISLFYFPRNWSGFTYLQFRVYNPSEPIVLCFRVHDGLHSENPVYGDRYNGQKNVQRGWNTIRISLDDVGEASRYRKIDLKNIYGLGLFIMNQKQKHQLYLDDFQLL